MPTLTASDWGEFLTRFPEAHLLQTGAWGELKAAFGWEVERIAAGGAGALLLFRRLPLGFSLAYIPKGPVGELAHWPALWPEVDAACRRRRAVFLKVEPDLWQGSPGVPEALPGFRSSPHSIQPPRTLLVDLRGDEDALLGRMKQKTRYNLRLAAKKGVRVRPSSDLETFHTLMLTTGARDRFGVHSLEYYRRCYALFQPRGECELFLADYEGEPLGGLLVFARGGRAWYFYGASADSRRELMPTYLLQWEAMGWAQGQGCREYDLWGVPDADEAALEAQFTARADGLWGVYRFKRGFGGALCRAAGPWDRVYNRPLYALYLRWLARREAGAAG